MTNFELNNKCLLLSERLHWIQFNTFTGEVDLFLDNHMMQTFRACESRFEEEMVHGYGGTGHFWFLDFGICVHTCIEYYYLHRKDSDFNVLQWAGGMAFEVWSKMNMDELYNSKSPWHHKNYTTLGGCQGFSSLLLEYASIFHTDNERFRVIGAELYFGKGKEVYLGSTTVLGVKVNLFLSGKIDLLMDDGFNIGPMDHKTSSNFMGKSPAVSYEIHEGMTGYVYAARELMKQIFSNYGAPHGTRPEEFKNRTSNKMWMNFLQVEPLPIKKKNGDLYVPQDRYKRIPMFYTDYQLEQYRKRMIATAARIMTLLLDPSPVYTRNTMMCTNYMRHHCSFHEVHRQNSRENELIQLNSSFKQGPIWDPENRDHENLITE